jgi:protein-S-isoprenylcysteine O-methyltransferase Ste14
MAWSFIVIGLVGLALTITRFGWPRALGHRVDTLKQTGLYARSRNPQVVVCGLAVVGYAMLWPSWHTIGWAVLYAVPAHLMVLTEEEHLGRVFGEEYAGYRDTVRRYL